MNINLGTAKPDSLEGTFLVDVKLIGTKLLRLFELMFEVNRRLLLSHVLESSQAHPLRVAIVAMPIPIHKVKPAVLRAAPSVVRAEK
jgi:hypothetical protein